MKTHRRLQTAGGFTLVELLVVITIIAALAGLTAPLVLKKVKEGPRVEASSNARQIGFALRDFEKDYGSFPDRTTFADVKANTESKLLEAGPGVFSNDYFRQLLACDLGNEKMFYAKANGTKKPDDNASTAATALAAGEVGFGYLMDGNTALSLSNNSDTPVVATPLMKGSSTEFDEGPFGGKAVILRIDGSASDLTINKSKKAMISTGKNLLQGGEGTVWGSEVKPKIAPPKLRGGEAGGEEAAPAADMNAE